MNEQRLIDANEVICGMEEIMKSPWYNDDKMTRPVKKETLGIVKDLCVGKAKTADAVPVVHARWEPIDGTGGGVYKLWRCSACKNGATAGDETGPDIPYCFCCGAKMDGGAEDGADRD